MGCSGTRKLVAGLFGQGKVDAAIFHRYAACCRASECKRLCKRLVKAPGVQAFCVDINTGEKTDLYASLGDSTFKCPDGRF